MSHGKADAEIVATTHNTARFFTENRHVAWVLLFGTVLWGVFGYLRMPQRKDPDIPIRAAMAMCPWPAVGVDKIEQLVTRRLEETIAQNVRVEKLESTTRVGLAFVIVTLVDATPDMGKEFDDIKLKLDTIRDLPEGAGPIQWIKDFGDTTALMLTVASPKIGEVQTSIMAASLKRAIEEVRPAGQADRKTMVYWFPQTIPATAVRRPFQAFVDQAVIDGALQNPKVFEQPGLLGVDYQSERGDEDLLLYGQNFIRTHLRASEFHPDVWPPVIIGDPAEAEAKLVAAAGDKYTYRELEEFTDFIKRTLQTIPIVSKVDRTGILDERVYLDYSQEQLASYGVQPMALRSILGSRNIPLPGGMFEADGKNLTIAPSGEFKSEQEIGDTLLISGESSLYLRNIVEVVRSYDSPPRFLNFFTHRGADGQWQRSRAITLSVQMRKGQNIRRFGEAVDEILVSLKQRLPDDLIYARTSDQPVQVRDSVNLFMRSLFEAVVLVVIIALVGFWEWRSALLLSLSIPLTLAMTFGMMSLIGLDLQQISIASLIIALGLLVDDPVVANDAIKRDLAAQHPPVVAAWLGPTKLATAILFATITNIVAYLPFLLLSGDTGKFLYSLPVVLTCSLVASRIVSMTFIPLLGYYLLRAPKKADRPMSERRTRGFTGRYYRAGNAAIRHRWLVFAASLLLVFGGFYLGAKLKPQFFPTDLMYLSYAELWLPEDTALSTTTAATRQAEKAIIEAAEAGNFELRSLTSFIGGGGPRFWFSVSPEPQQQNYAQIVMQIEDKHRTPSFVPAVQAAVTQVLPGVRFNARQLENGPPTGGAVSIRLAGDDIPTLRAEARKLEDIFRSIPKAEQIQQDWGTEGFVMNMQIDPDRANLAGVTNEDVALSSVLGMNGLRVAVLREGDKQIPVVARLRMEERAQLSDLQNLYVYSQRGTQRVPLRQISTVSYSMEQQKLKRRNQFRTITVSAYPVKGALASEIYTAAKPHLRRLEQQLPPGYVMEVGGEQAEQEKSFKELLVVLAVSVACIYLALVIQFRNAVKPVIVFAAIPYGMAGAMAGLWVMGSPFGFMAFLGVVSLVGVIVSHVIVLFDFIEEAHVHGAPLNEALLDAGVLRLRPVLVTVGATVLALFPLAHSGGPLWEPMCYSQIGGLTVATVVTLVLVPVMYSIFVLDLKLIKWDVKH